MKRTTCSLVPALLALAGLIFPLRQLHATTSIQIDLHPLPSYATDGLADDDSDDSDDQSLDELLDDLLQEDEGESVQEEQEAIREDELEGIAATTEEVYIPQAETQKRIIKTIQKKNFLKLGRFELNPNLAFVTNDPFLNRYIIGTGLAYHATEIYAIELNFGYAPDLGEALWKPLTDQLVNKNNVSPDISPLTLFSNATFAFSPIYGKVALSGQKVVNFDIFGAFGMGFTQTKEDLEALQESEVDPSPEVAATHIQIHPTTNFGGGVRVIMGESFAIRLEGRSLVYIETVSSTTLEMKSNFILQLGFSFFFPGMED